jgi:hypothetical protein
VLVGTTLNYTTSLAASTFSGNTYSGLYAPVTFLIDRNAVAADNGNPLARSQWVALPGSHNATDAANTPPDFKLAQFALGGTVTSNKITNGDFNSGTWSVYYPTSTTPATATPVTDSTCANAPCQSFTAQAGDSLTSSNSFSLAGSKVSLVTFDLKSPGVNAHANLTVRQAGDGGYASRGYNRDQWLGPEWRRFSIPFVSTAESGDHPSRIDFYGISGQPVLMDNISLVQADSLSLNDTTQDVLDLVNASGSSVSLACPTMRVSSCSNWVDTSGNPVTWPVTVPAWKIIALVWKGSPFYTGP